MQNNIINKANLINIGEKEVQPLIGLLEEVREKALDRVKIIKSFL